MMVMVVNGMLISYQSYWFGSYYVALPQARAWATTTASAFSPPTRHARSPSEGEG